MPNLDRSSAPFTLPDVLSGEPQLYLSRSCGGHCAAGSAAAPRDAGRAAPVATIGLGAAVLIAMLLAVTGAERAGEPAPAAAASVPAKRVFARADVERMLQDPAVRGFVGLAENAWDFTRPDGIPGFGDLDPELRPAAPARATLALAEATPAAPAAPSPPPPALLEPHVPEIVREFLFGATSIEETGVEPALLGAMTNWLTVNFELAPPPAHPRLVQTPPERFAALRYGHLVDAARGQAPAVPEDTTVALYLDAEQTIYLAAGWAGRTPAELSVLLHELVHHLQNLSGSKHECARAREKMAYAAQQRWLNLFGRDLESEFELDGFSLLAKTSCAY